MRVVQIPLSSDYKEQVSLICRHIEDAANAGCDYVVFPEYATHALSHRVAAFAHATALPEVTKIFTTVRDCEISTTFGSVTAAAYRRVFSSFITITNDQIATTDKHYIYTANGKSESWVVNPGTRSPISNIAGMLVEIVGCVDLRYPERFARGASAGVDLFVVPSAWVDGPYKLAQWQTLLKARAIETVSYVCGVDAAPGMPEFGGIGHSMCIDPNGEVIAELGPEPGFFDVELDHELIGEYRSARPQTLIERAF